MKKFVGAILALLGFVLVGLTVHSLSEIGNIIMHFIGGACLTAGFTMLIKRNRK